MLLLALAILLLVVIDISSYLTRIGSATYLIWNLWNDLSQGTKFVLAIGTFIALCLFSGAIFVSSMLGELVTQTRQEQQDRGSDQDQDGN